MTKKTHRLLKGTLYAQVQDLDERRLSLKYALLAAILLEVVLPIIIFNFDWSVNLESIDPLPHQAMSVLLDVPPDIDESSAEKITKKKINKPKELANTEQVPLVPPKPLPNEQLSKILLPKESLEPKVEPEQEEELPPLPSVFRDVKPVKKVKPKYPREAEDKKIEGRVKVRMKVSVDGSVSSVELVFAEPPGVFEKEVLEAAQKFVFKKDGSTYYADQVFVFIVDP